MPSISSQQLASLQANTQNIRNICILAHVDHGKTTLSDSLLASNGIISQKLSGKLRYLDSRLDEQERGITMKSSAVALYFKILRELKSTPNSDPSKTSSDSIQSTTASEYLIHLIDSPGHIDFSSEVTSALQLCDGALVLIDVIEGICTQTHTVLHQAFQERIKPILVLNKVDRLITELKLTSSEAYERLNRIIEGANAIMGTFWSSERVRQEGMKYEASKLQESMDGEQSSVDVEAEAEMKEASDFYFAPEVGNVIFASAIDGWGFRPSNFAQLYSVKLNIRELALRKLLWGEYFLDPKTKKVLQPKHFKHHKHLIGKEKLLKPLAVQFMLDNLWKVYEACGLGIGAEREGVSDKDQIDKIVAALKIKVNPRDLKSKDPKVLVQAIMSQWLPLSTCSLLTVTEQLPSPMQAQPIRLPRILHPEVDSSPQFHSLSLSFSSDPSMLLPEIPIKYEWEKSLYNCHAEKDVPVVAFISKMFSVDADQLPENKRPVITAEEMRERGRLMREKLLAAKESAAELTQVTERLESISIDPSNSSSKSADSNSSLPTIPLHATRLIGMARLYSGTLRPGQRLSILGPKYQPSKPDLHRFEITVDKLYLLMGRELEKLDEVKPGMIFGIGGEEIEKFVLKSATLSSEIKVGSFVRTDDTSAPIVRVAVEPKNPADMEKLANGLTLLNQADPAVQVLVQETGEHVILTSGELHLERCLRDLRELYAKCQIHVSPPIVPFRETIVKAPAQAQFLESNDSSLPSGTIITYTPNKQCCLRIRSVPLPNDIISYLNDHSPKIKEIAENLESGDERDTCCREFLNDFQKCVEQMEDEREREEWRNVSRRIWSFGPKRFGCNILVNDIPGYNRLPWLLQSSLLSQSKNPSDAQSLAVPSEMKSANPDVAKFLDANIVTGFQLATGMGPLCHEPMVGVAFFVEELKIGNFTTSGNGKENVGASEIQGSAEEEGSNNSGMQTPQINLSALSGQIMTTVREACRNAFLQWSPRLMLAMFSCDIQCLAEVLGKVYAVIAKRRGRILSEEMKEGTPFFEIKAMLPVIESFGFSDDIRKKTSGNASPQLIFAGWEKLDQDPFWVPTTEEELEDLGEKSDRENLARRYMDNVRRRKGMFVEKKIVEHAEKQRTLMKK